MNMWSCILHFVAVCTNNTLRSLSERSPEQQSGHYIINFKEIEKKRKDTGWSKLKKKDNFCCFCSVRSEITWALDQMFILYIWPWSDIIYIIGIISLSSFWDFCSEALEVEEELELHRVLRWRSRCSSSSSGCGFQLVSMGGQADGLGCADPLS